MEVPVEVQSPLHKALSRSSLGDSLPHSDVEEATHYGSTGSSSMSPKRTHSRRKSFTSGETMFKSRYATWTVEEDKDTMGDAEIVINLLADLTPAGVLPLAFGMSGTGYVPAVAILLMLTGVAAYMMHLIARTIEISGKNTYDQIWSVVIGPKSAWVPTTVVSVVCFGNCLAYACMFGDLFAGCMPALGLTFATRTVCVVALAAFPLLPLCMLKDLSALAPTSLGALLAVLYTVGMMGFRYYDGSYAPGGQYYVSAPLSSAGHVLTVGPSTLLLVNALAVAYLCHYNACKYYREYKDHRPGMFVKQIFLAFTGVCFLLAASMLFGYATFGAIASGVVLNNYATTDGMANAARFGMGIANLLSFPLMFSGLREAALALMAFFSPSMVKTFGLVWFQNALSAGLLVLIIAAAVVLTDAGLVVGLVGSICGSTIIYIVPCLLFERACRTFLDDAHRVSNFGERIIVRIIGLIGIILAITGTWASVVF